MILQFLTEHKQLRNDEIRRDIEKNEFENKEGFFSIGPQTGLISTNIFTVLKVLSLIARQLTFQMSRSFRGLFCVQSFFRQ